MTTPQGDGNVVIHAASPSVDSKIIIGPLTVHADGYVTVDLSVEATDAAREVLRLLAEEFGVEPAADWHSPPQVEALLEAQRSGIAAAIEARLSRYELLGEGAAANRHTVLAAFDTGALIARTFTKGHQMTTPPIDPAVMERAVEAAARAICTEAAHAEFKGKAGMTGPCDWHLTQARAALAAALPDVIDAATADAWDEGAIWAGAIRLGGIVSPANPYRKEER